MWFYLSPSIHLLPYVSLRFISWKKCSLRFNGIWYICKSDGPIYCKLTAGITDKLEISEEAYEIHKGKANTRNSRREVITSGKYDFMLKHPRFSFCELFPHFLTFFICTSSLLKELGLLAYLIE